MDSTDLGLIWSGLEPAEALRFLSIRRMTDCAITHINLASSRTAPAQGSPDVFFPKVGLASGVPRILPRVQFCQICQAVYRQLLIIALAGRRQGLNISANFLPRICNLLDRKGMHRFVGIQNKFNHLIHGKLQSRCNNRSAPFLIFVVNPTETSRPGP
jgi:hypothetical protein